MFKWLFVCLVGLQVSGCCVQVRERLIQLGTQRGNMMELWEQRWEHLQLSTLFPLFILC